MKDDNVIFLIYCALKKFSLEKIENMIYEKESRIKSRKQEIENARLSYDLNPPKEKNHD